MTQQLFIHTTPPYPVTIGRGLLASCGQTLRPLLGDCRLALISDHNVAPLYGEQVRRSLMEAGFDVISHIFPAGEAHKTLDTLSDLLNTLAQNQLTRSDCVLALGGGVCGDMAGFAAAVYLRGIRYVQLPTTLLSAVDSSVGGKTAIDLNAGKNMAGAFLQPTAVLCDVDTLSTLSPEVFADGAAEAIKTGVLAGESLFSAIEAGQLRTNPEAVIAACAAYKAAVVERDEKETGERRLLNLGHTAGHAIERLSGYEITHGHAVAAGLAILCRAAERLGWAEAPIARRVCACLHAHHLPTTTCYSPADLAQAARSDKKRSGERITLSVPLSIGRCVPKTISVDQLEDVFRAGWED